MTAVSDADREKAIEALNELSHLDIDGIHLLTVHEALDGLIEAGWRPPVSATLDPRPWLGKVTGLRYDTNLRLSEDGLIFAPRPEYVQDRAAYEPASATPEQEALRERIAGKLRGKPVHVEFEGRALIVEVGGESAYTLADAVLAVLPSHETVAPTEEQIAEAMAPLADVMKPGGIRVVTSVAYALHALFPGVSREAVEATQRERDALIAESEFAKRGAIYAPERWAGRDIAAAIREADRG